MMFWRFGLPDFISNINERCGKYATILVTDVEKLVG